MIDIIKYKNELIDLELHNINKNNKGFLSYNCYSFMFNHLIACLEAKPILNKEREDNVIKFIKKIEDETNIE